MNRQRLGQIALEAYERYVGMSPGVRNKTSAFEQLASHVVHTFLDESLPTDPARLDQALLVRRTAKRDVNCLTCGHRPGPGISFWEIIGKAETVVKNGAYSSAIIGPFCDHCTDLLHKETDRGPSNEELLDKLNA